jgi:hypothetical protein
MKLFISSIHSLRPGPPAKVDALEIERDNGTASHRRVRSGRLTLNAAQHQVVGTESLHIFAVKYLYDKVN